MPVTFRCCLGLLLLLLLCRCGVPGDDCALRIVTRFPVETEHGLMIASVTINGQPVRMIVDTGAERTVISRSAADRLHLSGNAGYITRSAGVGGRTESQDALIDRFALGGMSFPLPRVVVGTFKAATLDGLLGADLLLAFDMEIDNAHRVVTLYHSRTCANTGPPWPGPAIPINAVARKDRLLLPFQIDSTPGLALLDTGAAGNVLTAAMANRLGLSDADVSADPIVRHIGAGPNEIMARLHRFQQLRVGPITETAPLFSVLPNNAVGTDGILGQRFLRGRRIWISFRTRRVFLSPVAEEH